MEQKFCQSCGMPLNPEVLGTEKDGSKNEEYCTYCYADGHEAILPNAEKVETVKRMGNSQLPPRDFMTEW